MQYDQEKGTVEYRTKKKGKEQVVLFSALNWLAALSAHIPSKGEPMVAYDGFYSNRMRGDREKKGKKSPEVVQSNPDEDSEFKAECRRN